MQNDELNKTRAKNVKGYPSFSNQKKVFLNYNFMDKNYSPTKIQKSYQFCKIQLKKENDVNSTNYNTLNNEDSQLIDITENLRLRNNRLQENKIKRSSELRQHNTYVMQGHINKSPNLIPKVRSKSRNNKSPLGSTDSVRNNQYLPPISPIKKKKMHEFSWMLTGNTEDEMKSAFLSENFIDKVLKDYPLLTKKDIFLYHADFIQMTKMSNSINKTTQPFITLKVFEHFALMFQFHSRSELNRIYNAIRVNRFILQVGLMDWEKFLYLRVLTDDKGNKSDVIDFLYTYFDESGTKQVEEVEVIHSIQQAAHRITTTNEIINKEVYQRNQDLNSYKYNYNLQRIGILFKDFLDRTANKFSYFHSSQKEVIEKCMIQVNMISNLKKKEGSSDFSRFDVNQEEKIAIFSDQYASSIWKWMVHSGIIQNGILIKEKMLLSYDTNKYVFLLLVNSFLGFFYGDFFTWVKDIRNFQ